MDPFTETILQRARQRQLALDTKAQPLRECTSDGNLIASAHCLNTNKGIKETRSDTQLLDYKENKFLRQSSKTRVSSEMPGSPLSQIKTLNIQRDNINMEIKVTSKDAIRVEVEIDSDGESVSSESGLLRDEARRKLNRLGQLYGGGDDDAGISSPIHRSKESFGQDADVDVIPTTDNKEQPRVKGKGLKKLADLASNINQWEDEKINFQQAKNNKSPERKAWTRPLQKSQQKSSDSPTKVSQKQRAPQPPQLSPQKEIPNSKQLKWDQKVLDSLESQGFTRSTSNAKLVYAYNSQEHQTASSSPKVVNTRPKLVPSEDGRKSPKKSGSSVANVAALFEANRSPVKNARDPALMSVAERKALFERNKGEALLPKVAIGMSAPAVKTTNKSKQQQEVVLLPAKKTTKYPAPKPPKPPQSVAICSYQTGGIASKMAALMEEKSTISEEQIIGNSRQQRQKEIDLLLNRFNRNKIAQETGEQSDKDIEDESEDESEDEDERTAMLGNCSDNTKKKTRIQKSPPALEIKTESRKSGGKRTSTSSDSAVVAQVLEDVKRIKVSPPKAGKLYPNLSDIEATTETETEAQTPSPDDSRRNDSFPSDSDDPNTSFGRDILAQVTKNHSPKRPIYDESTASDISSVLDDLDELDEDVGGQGPTPPKYGRQCSATSSSFNYKHCPQEMKSDSSQMFKSPMKVPSPRKSLDNQQFVVDGDNVVPLTHTVSFYRKQQSQQQNVKTPIRQVIRQPLIEEPIVDQVKMDEEVEKRIKQLRLEVSKQENIIAQTSQALNLCNNTPEFSGSTEQVEAEKVLLVSTHRRQAALQEMQRIQVEGTLRPLGGEHAQHLPVEEGTLTISDVVLPLKRKYVTALANTGGKGHHVVCLVKCLEQVIPMQLVSTVATSKKNPDLDLYIPGSIKLQNIHSDFCVTLEVYTLQAQEEYLPHDIKYHINNSGKKSGHKLMMTPKKSKQDPRMQSPAGPQAVRSTSFSLMGYAVFSVQQVQKKLWTLNNCPPMSPLEGSVEMKIACDLAVSVEHRGFLTMFEDVSGFGAWHRRWCLLQGHSLSYWKYPDDERKQPPIDTINLKNCITKKVEPVARDICARLNTFLIERERMAKPRDKDTLVLVRQGDKTLIRHLLSADTKLERIKWCEKFNAALTALRMWGNSD